MTRPPLAPACFCGRKLRWVVLMVDHGAGTEPYILEWYAECNCHYKFQFEVMESDPDDGADGGPWIAPEQVSLWEPGK